MSMVLRRREMWWSAWVIGALVLLALASGVCQGFWTRFSVLIMQLVLESGSR